MGHVSRMRLPPPPIHHPWPKGGSLLITHRPFPLMSSPTHYTGPLDGPAAELNRSPIKPEREAACFDPKWIFGLATAPLSSPSFLSTRCMPMLRPPLDVDMNAGMSAAQTCPSAAGPFTPWTDSPSASPSTPTSPASIYDINPFDARERRLVELQDQVASMKATIQSQEITIQQQKDRIAHYESRSKAKEVIIDRLATVVRNTIAHLRCGMCKRFSADLRGVGDCGHMVCHECLYKYQAETEATLRDLCLTQIAKLNTCAKRCLWTPHCPMKDCDGHAVCRGVPLCPIFTLMSELPKSIQIAIEEPVTPTSAAAAVDTKSAAGTYTVAQAIVHHKKQVIAALAAPNTWPVGAPKEYPAMQPATLGFLSDAYQMPTTRPAYHQTVISQAIGYKDHDMTQMLQHYTRRAYQNYQTASSMMVLGIAGVLLRMLLDRKDKQQRTLRTGARVLIRPVNAVCFQEAHIDHLLPLVYCELRLALARLNLPAMAIEVDKESRVTFVGGGAAAIPSKNASEVTSIIIEMNGIHAVNSYPLA